MSIEAELLHRLVSTTPAGWNQARRLNHFAQWHRQRGAGASARDDPTTGLKQMSSSSRTRREACQRPRSSPQSESGSKYNAHTPNSSNQYGSNILQKQCFCLRDRTKFYHEVCRRGKEKNRNRAKCFNTINIETNGSLPEGQGLVNKESNRSSFCTNIA